MDGWSRVGEVIVQCLILALACYIVVLALWMALQPLR